jgi:hypothetical protein
MLTSPPTVGDGTCYKRCNDGGASSFRNRDDDVTGIFLMRVKSLFNRLIPRQELE